MAVYIDPIAASNGAGTFADPRNTPVGITYSDGETYLFAEGTTWSNTASIVPTQNNVIYGTYDSSTGAQIQDNTRHATIRIAGAPGINGGNRTGIVIDNLQIIGNASDVAYPIQALYTNSGTALNMTIRRCIIHSPLGNRAAIRARGDGITIENCVVTHEAILGSAIELTAINITIAGCDVTAATGSAITATTSAATPQTEINFSLTDTVVESNGTAGSAGHGVSVTGRGVSIDGLTVRRAWRDGVQANTQTFTLRNSVFHNFDMEGSSGDGVQLVNTHDKLNVIIANNQFFGNRGSPLKQCILVGEGTGNSQTGAVIIRGNYCFGHLTSIISCADNSRIVGNHIVNPVGGGISAQGNNTIVDGNLVVAAGGSALYVEDGLSGVKFYNNTVVDCSGACINFESSTGEAKNNIAIRAEGSTTALVIERSGTCTLDRNIYYAKDGTANFEWNSLAQASFADWKTASSQDANSVNTDPLLNADYRPIPESAPGAGDGSPCLEAGIYIPGARDYSGRKLRNPPDIGARQYYVPHGAVSPLRGGVAAPRSGVSTKRTAVLNRSSRG